MAVIQVFMEIRQAKNGDLMLNYDGTEEEIKSIEYISDVSDVYNLEVAGNHNYFAENVLVHNKCGKYKGSDVVAKADIRRNREAWETTQESMELLDAQAKDLIAQAERQSSAASDIFAGQTKARQIESRQLFEQASAEAGRTGLAVGESTRRVTQVGDIARDATQQAKTVYASEQKGLEQQVGASLFEIEGAKSSLFANYVSGMAGDYSNVPEYESSYAGGYTVGQDWAGGSGEAFSSRGGPGDTFDPSKTAGSMAGWATKGATIGAAGGSFMPGIGTMVGGGIGAAVGAGIGLLGSFWKASNKLGSGACLTADTKVDNKDIYEVRVGDMVSSYNKDKNIIEKSKVIKTFKHKDNSGYLIINGRIKTTPNHPFYIKRYV